VVQKPRRPRKGKEGTTQTQHMEEKQQSEKQVFVGNSGSRFSMLNVDDVQDSKPPTFTGVTMWGN